MKTLGILLSILLIAAVAHGQPMQMRIHMNDGSIVSYPTDSVAKFTLTPFDTVHIRTMVLSSPYSSNGFVSQPDSVVFGTDVLNRKGLLVWQGGGPWQEGYLSFGPARDPRFHNRPEIDSINFGLNTKNPNVIQLPWKYFDPKRGDSLFSDYSSVAWGRNRIFCTTPGRWFELDSALEITRDSLLDSSGENGNTGRLSLSLNQTNTRLLSVKSPFWWGSLGRLVENRLDHGGYEVIDSIHPISSAVYAPGTNDIIYYSYGSYSDTGATPNLNPADAGYYYLNRTSGKVTFLLQYIASGFVPKANGFEGETVNGFDISPDGKTLLIAAVMAGKMPRIIECDLASKKMDTLPVHFNSALGNSLLWLRFSHDGNRILYGNYPSGAIGDGTAYQRGEIGIIDRYTFAKQILATDPDDMSIYVPVFPQWSPDDNMIVYCSGAISLEPPGLVGGFGVCILRNFK